ncbi:MAG: hypothetical protein MJZ71_02780 [Bacteroidales bacterium]|nr:hypothetical protein [Bacteroidales bacterium]
MIALEFLQDKLVESFSGGWECAFAMEVDYAVNIAKKSGVLSNKLTDFQIKEIIGRIKKDINKKMRFYQTSNKSLNSEFTQNNNSTIIKAMDGGDFYGIYLSNEGVFMLGFNELEDFVECFIYYQAKYITNIDSVNETQIKEEHSEISLINEDILQPICESVAVPKNKIIETIVSLIKDGIIYEANNHLYFKNDQKQQKIAGFTLIANELWNDNKKIFEPYSKVFDVDKKVLYSKSRSQTALNHASRFKRHFK